MVKNLILGPILTQIWAPNFFRGFYFYQQLYIVPSYHPMQVQGKLSNQTSENGKKSNFGANFDPLDPSWPLSPKFYVDFTSVNSQTLPQANILCNIQKKEINQSSENGEKHNFGPNFDSFGPNLGPLIFFVDLTSASGYFNPSYHPVQYKRKLKNQT